MDHASPQLSALPGDFSPRRRLMSPETVIAIQDAFDAPDPDRMLESRLRPAARMVCDDARRSGMRVEQMLVALKREWAELLTSRNIENIDERTDLTSRFITLCIHEFYADSPARGADRDTLDGVRHTPAP